VNVRCRRKFRATVSPGGLAAPPPRRARFAGGGRARSKRLRRRVDPRRPE